MMGGELSQERTSEEGEAQAETKHDSESHKSSDSAASEDTPGELPQCQMGSKKVDNMCFMISCTNWY